MSSETQREITYGEKAVGLTFNPSGDENVNKIKRLYAEIIDLCAKGRTNAVRHFTYNQEQARLFSVAITEAQTAQMWAVKALTWRY